MRIVMRPLRTRKKSSVFVTVELANDPGLPMLGEGGEFLGEVDCCHGCLRVWVSIDPGLLPKHIAQS
jgi:hypothetical protein